MAGNIKGITIEFRGETTKLQQALKTVNDSTRKIDKELRQVNRGLKFNPTNVDLWRQKQQLLTQKVNETKDKLDALKQAQAKLDGDKDVDKTSDEYRKLQREIIETESKLKTFKTQLKQVGNVKLKALSEQFKQVGSKMKNIGKDLTTKMTVPLVGIGAAALKTSSEFDTAMSQVAATKGVGVDSIKELRDFAIEMGAKTAFSAKDAAEGLNYMALAGYDSQKSMEMLPTVLNLAAAGSMDLAQASDMVTDAASALGLSTEETTALVDNMAKTSSTTNTSVEQLGRAILKIGGTAKLMKGGPEELSQVLGILADNGIKGAKGGTALRNMILSLSAPTDKAAATLKDLGIDVFDAQGNMRSMQDIMGDMNGALGKLSDKERTEAIAAIFNKQDIGAANALLDTSVDRWNEVSEAISGAKGSAEEMAKTQLDNLEGSITLLKSALSSAGIAIGSVLTPYIQGLADWLTKLVTKFNDLSDRNKKIITFIGVFLAAVGPVVAVLGAVVGAIGTVFGAISTFIGAIGGAITFVTNMGGVLATLSAAFQVVVAAIGGFIASIGIVPIIIAGVVAAIIAIGVALWKNWDKIKAKAIEIKDKVVKTFTDLKKGIDDQIKMLKLAIGMRWAMIKKDITDKVNAIKTKVTSVFTTLKTKVTDIWTKIKTAMTKPIQSAKTAIAKVIDKIKSLFNFNFSWPKLTLPHFSVSPKGWKAGDLLKGKIPTLGISWYDQGGIFDRPSVIGVGEKRPEFVGALDDLRKIVREESGAQQTVTINVYASENQSVQEIAKEVERRLIESQNRRRLAWK